MKRIFCTLYFLNHSITFNTGFSDITYELICNVPSISNKLIAVSVKKLFIMSAHFAGLKMSPPSTKVTALLIGVLYLKKG